MQEIAHVKTFLENQLPQGLELLRQMVGINSYTTNREGVNHLARFTAECFAPLGFAAEFVPAVNPLYGDHLVLTRRGRSPKTIAMVSHLDTVFPPKKKFETTSNGSLRETEFTVRARKISKAAAR